MSCGLSFWLKPGIAYITITQFSETTSKELEEKMKMLGEGNIKGLVLDLRGNPGGLLNEGVEVAGHFLKRNDLVVSRSGRATAARGAGSGSTCRVSPTSATRFR